MTHYHSNRTTRLEERRKALSNCFTIPRLQNAWKTYVRPGLRDQYILDLHDHFDFHRNKESIFKRLRHDIMVGSYRPTTPLTIRLEKKAGLTRRLCIPSAEDAIILQALSDLLLPQVKKNQPSNNAFFSRSHGFKPPEIEIDDAGDYFWFIKWKEFSKKRLSFTSIFTTICITDIANYFDTVDFSQLRILLSHICSTDEVIFDLLFLTLEHFAWKPDYLPFMGRGLPQVNFDAPRLLAHAFLFEADSLLMKRTDNYFVRWVDDITIASNGEDDAKAILRDLDELLLTRGLRLNSGKTIILNAKDYVKYLWRDENQYLTVSHNRVARLKTAGRSLKPESQRLRKRFQSFIAQPRTGYWDKIYKRYFSNFMLLGDRYLEKYVPDALQDTPSVRDAIFLYYSHLGPSPKRLEQLSNFLSGTHVVDDASIFGVALVLVKWNVSSHSKLGRAIAQLGERIGQRSFIAKNWTYFLASLWILGKYGNLRQLEKTIFNNENCWRLSPFLSRQVAAVSPRFVPGSTIVRKMRDSFIHYGHLGAINVLSNLAELRKLAKLDSPLHLYLVPSKRPEPNYPLSKALISISVLRSQTLPTSVRQRLRDEILSQMADPTYRRWVAQAAR